MRHKKNAQEQLFVKAPFLRVAKNKQEINSPHHLHYVEKMLGVYLIQTPTLYFISNRGGRGGQDKADQIMDVTVTTYAPLKAKAPK